jgi:hypothetical protein
MGFDERHIDLELVPAEGDRGLLVAAGRVQPLGQKVWRPIGGRAPLVSLEHRAASVGAAGMSTS